MPASPDELAEALAFALAHSGGRRVHDASETMAKIVAGELVEAFLERAGLVIMQLPPIGGGAALGRAFEPS